MPNLKEDAREVVEKNRQFVSDHEAQLQNYLDYYKHYLVEPTPLRKEIRSNPAIPEIHSEVEAIATAWFEMFYSDNTEAGFFVVDEQREEYMDLARYAQANLVKRLEMIEFPRKFLSMLRWTALNGMSFAKLPWILREKDTMVRRGGSFVKNRTVDFDSFDYKIISPLYARYSPSSVNIQDGWFALEYPISLDDAKMQEKMGFFKNVSQAVGSQGSDSRRFDDQRRSIAGRTQSTYKDKNSLYIIEYWGQLASRESLSNRFYVSSNGTVLREPEDNPYPHGKTPVSKSMFVDLGDEFEGIGVGKVNSRGQDEINEHAALNLDILLRQAYGQIYKLRGAGIEDDDLVYKPNGIIEGDIRDALTPIRPPVDGLVMAMRMQEMRRSDMQRASAASSALQAIPIDTSVGQFRSIHAESIRRLKVIAQANIGAHLKECLYQFHENCLALADSSVLVEILGEDGARTFEEANRKDLPKSINLKIKTSLDSASRISSLRNFNDFMGQLAELKRSDPSLQINYAKLGKLASKMFGYDPEEIIIEAGVQAELANPATRKVAAREALSQLASQGRETMAQNASA